MSLKSLIKFQQCEQWLYNCPFSVQPQTCIDHFCAGEPEGFGSCSADFPVPGACCQKTDSAACLASFQATLTRTTTGACATLRSAIIECNTASNFSTIAPQDQASCLCYNSVGSYVPTIWDDAATSCYSSGSSAHPVLYSILTAQSSEALGFCTKYAGPSAIVVTTTATAAGTSISSAATASAGGASTTQGMGVTTSGTSSQGTNATTSSATTSATTKASAATKVHHLDVKLLVISLGLILPFMVTTVL